MSSEQNAYKTTDHHVESLSNDVPQDKVLELLQSQVRKQSDPGYPALELEQIKKIANMNEDDDNGR